MPISIRELTIPELGQLSLEQFDRTETGTKVCRSDGFDRTIIECDYEVGGWTDAEKQKIVSVDWRNCLYGLGKVLIAADESGEIVGFCEVWNAHLGMTNDASDVMRLHVSAPMRRQGIGSALMKEAERITREFNMKRIYVSAHPGEQTQYFLEKMGFSLALDVCREHAVVAPDEIQMDKKIAEV